MSRKMRSALKTKGSMGYAVGQPPYGYRHDESDYRRWAVDPEASEIVQYIYSLRQNGTNVNEIDDILKRKKILIPSLYAQRKGYKTPTKRSVQGEHLWDKSNVRQILTNRSYVGDIGLRTTAIDDVRALCIKKNWYTCGTNREYDNLFKLVARGGGLMDIAYDIYDHSNYDYCSSVGAVYQ